MALHVVHPLLCGLYTLQPIASNVLFVFLSVASECSNILLCVLHVLCRAFQSMKRVRLSIFILYT